MGLRCNQRALVVLTLLGVLGCDRQPSDGVVAEYAAPAGGRAHNLAEGMNGPILSWIEPVGEGRHAFRVAVRENGGWRTVGTVVENDSLFVNWADFPSVVELADGTWIAHWLQKVAPATYAYHVKMAVSTDRGATWSSRFVPHSDRSPTEHGFVSMVPWRDGAAAVWLDGQNTLGGHETGEELLTKGAMTLRFTTITPDGTPAPDMEIDPKVCDCCQTALVRAGDALVTAYRDRAEGEIRDIVVSRFANGAWSEPRKVADDGWYYPGCPVNGPSLAARGDTVAIAWFTAADDNPRAYTAWSFDGGVTFSEAIRVDDGRPLGRMAVVFMPDGDAVVAWLEETDTTGSVRLRRVRPSGRTGRSLVAAEVPAVRASGFPRLAVVDGGVLVAWTDPEEDGGVKVARVVP